MLHVTEQTHSTPGHLAPLLRPPSSARVVRPLLLQPVGEGPFLTSAESFHPHRRATQTARAQRAWHATAFCGKLSSTA